MSWPSQAAAPKQYPHLFLKPNNSPTAMADPATRSYPTTVTTIYSTTIAGAVGITIDRVTVLDPWPTSPDPEKVPFTMLETQVTERTVSPPGAAVTPTVATTTAISTWILWGVLDFDMPPYSPPVCPGPGGCSYGTIKPNGRCMDLGWETTCASQCLLKDWMWWCAKSADSSAPPMGRVCAPVGNTTTYLQLYEPCDHTDYKTGCTLCGDSGVEGEV
ncbi:hypothetical protein B0H66DRAFT_536437 [Apodospora peruviana]|uniref:Uncharacterized protein n=1 Tax=Apodospora peruviana TaxID=516989 RepID=A0AAE0M1A3_9PEZI|nr:hypothetical protein B0H66DRAFT_536437 [Apodospora peruviana]